MEIGRKYKQNDANDDEVMFYCIQLLKRLSMHLFEVIFLSFNCKVVLKSVASAFATCVATLTLG